MELPSKNEIEEVKQRYPDNLIYSKLICRRLWTSKDDRILEKAIAIHGTNWKEVSKMLKLRNPSQCAQRWKRIKPETHRSRYAWTAEEDKQLLELVQVYQRNWRQIAQVMKRRTGKQVRERYINKLNPDIRQDPFNLDEDRIILEWYNRIGPKWTEISKQLQGRPVYYYQIILQNNKKENMIKNRFYSSIRKQQVEEPPSPKVEYTDFKKPVGIYKKIKPIKFKPTRPLTRNAAKQEIKQQKQQKQQNCQSKQQKKKEPQHEEQKEEKQDQIVIKIEDDLYEQRERSRRVFEHFQRQYQIYKRFLEVNSPLKIQPFMSKNTDQNIIQCQIQEHINLARNESFYLPTQLSYGNLWNNLTKQI